MSMVKPIDEGRSALYLYTSNGIQKILAIDLANWTARLVPVKNGPSLNRSTNNPGKWLLIQNQSGELLLEYRNMEARPVIALWMYNELNGAFELKVQETYQYDERDPLNAFVDYQRKEFVSWVLDQSLLFKRPTVLSREETLPPSKEERR